MCQGAEFDVYSKYTEDVLRPVGKERLYALLERSDLNSMLEVGDVSQSNGNNSLHCLHYMHGLDWCMLTRFLLKSMLCYQQSVGPKDGFKDAVRYVLPKLLLGPIHHCLHYSDVLAALAKTSPDADDIESINNAKSMMHSGKTDVERKWQQANQIKRTPGYGVRSCTITNNIKHSYQPPH